MVFKRRDKRPWGRTLQELLWPRGGWGRAFTYVKHRVRRLPDSPERIARGIWAGIFVTFTPFIGLHFIAGALLAYVMRGNVLAALMATFFGNPLTFVPIGALSLEIGHSILGSKSKEDYEKFGKAFVNAWRDLTHNFFAIFDDEVANWTRLRVFYDDVFLPYLVGGIIPGVITATAFYYLAKPLISAYQHRRRGTIRAKFEALKAKAAKSKVDQPGE